MKKLLLSALALTMGTGMLSAQAPDSARVQVIHNCPDAQMVDVYWGTTKILDDFEYRTASGFVNLAAGTDSFYVAPSTSTSNADAIYGVGVTLIDDVDYVAFAAGLTAGTPSFGLYVATTTDVAQAGTTDLTIFHGAHDAPTISVRGEDTVTVVVDSLSFGQATVPPVNISTASDAVVRLTTPDGATVVASYTAPLSTLDGMRAAIFASGYFAPTSSTDPEFGLYAAVDDLVQALPAVVTSVSRAAEQALALKAYPNPAQSQIQLDFTLQAEQEVAFQVYDMQGRLVQETAARTLSTGAHTETINISELSNGLYNIMIITAEGAQNVKLQVAK